MSWNKPSEAPKPLQKKKPNAMRGAIAGLAVVAILGVAAFFIFGGKDVKPNVVDVTGKSAWIAGVKQAKAQVQNGNRVVKPAKPNGGISAPTGKIVKARSSQIGQVMTMMDGTIVTNKPRNVFKRDFERTLLVAIRPGGMSRVLLHNLRKKYSDEQIVQMLREKTIIGPDDDEGVQNIKTMVQSAKDEFLAAVEGGASVSDILEDLQKRSNFEGSMRTQAARIRVSSIREKDLAIGKEYFNAANIVLEQNGLRKMPMPAQFKSNDVGEDTYVPTQSNETKEKNDEERD